MDQSLVLIIGVGLLLLIVLATGYQCKCHAPVVKEEHYAGQTFGTRFGGPGPSYGRENYAGQTFGTRISAAGPSDSVLCEDSIPGSFHCEQDASRGCVSCQ